MSRRWLQPLIALALLLAGFQAAMAANALRAVTLEAPGTDGARLRLQLSGPARQKVFVLEKPDRIVVDLPNTRVASGLRLPVAAGLVRGLRSGMQADGSLRLVLTLDRAIAPRVTASGNVLSIELGAAPAAAASPASSTPAAPPAPVRVAQAPGATPRDIIIAVDAGHGGDDPGAIGASGTREKDVVLAIARALARRIDAEPGMRAFLTRDGDRRIPLQERIDLARRNHADMFISVHADSIANRQVSGSSVYVLNEHGASSEAARWLADNENKVDGNSASLKGIDESVASVLVDLSQTFSITSSMEAAQRVLAHLDRVGTVRKSRVEQAPFRVLKSRDIPALLVETAYISNPVEEKKLGTPAHQTAVAEAIFNGARDYFRENPPNGSLYARQRAGERTQAAIVADSAGP